MRIGVSSFLDVWELLPGPHFIERIERLVVKEYTESGAFAKNDTMDHGAGAPSCFGLAAKFDVSAVMQAWWLGDPLPARVSIGDPLLPLYGLSPACTRMVTVYSLTSRELWVNDTKYGDLLVKLPLEDEDLGSGEVYDLIFESETRFYLKIDGPRQHVQIPYDIIPSSSGQYLYDIVKGEPVPLTEPRATAPPFALDANCEWVLDADSRKICWMSPGNLRRGNGGHFWVGSSLVMVGDDGVVRKVSFKEPGCWGIRNTYMQNKITTVYDYA